MRVSKLFVFLCLLIVYTSCKKNSDSISLTPDFYFLDGDTSSLNGTLVLFSSSDTATINLIISSTYLLSKTTDVTLAVADTARSSYNAYHSTAYQAMPANAYSFSTTFTVTTISTSTTPSIYDTIPVKIFRHLLNPASSYMLPIEIVSAGGNKILPGSSVIYLHTVNNKLSGVYNSTGTKILYNGDALNNNIDTTDSFVLTKNITPSAYANVSQLDYADLGSNGWKYYLSFSAANDYVFAVTPNEVILNSVQTGSFKILNSAYDSTTNNIYIKSSYKNLSGDERIIEESLKLY